MKYSGRAARMERHHARHKAGGGLNLVSLMDIFTILVFFLLVHSGDAEVLQSSTDVVLPESISQTKPRETVVVLVTPDEVLVQGEVVGRVAEIMARNTLIIPELKVALLKQNDRVLSQDARDDIANREVTILGDRDLPYSLLKKIMATCTDADYGQLSLAVMQKDPEGAQSAAVGG
ncbi:MAG TPA: biopolymer transporter ExbD [Gammaproteobacteria bacterium]|jgi:biopolymer transport protein ExbD